MRRLSTHFRSGLEAMIREAEMEEMEKKWKAQNEKIMLDHPEGAPAEMEPTGALPPPRKAEAPDGWDDEQTAPETGHGRVYPGKGIRNRTDTGRGRRGSTPFHPAPAPRLSPRTWPSSSRISTIRRRRCSII